MGQPDKPIREVSVEGCEVLGRGGNGAVYRLDDETIVKEYFKELGISQNQVARTINMAPQLLGRYLSPHHDCVRSGSRR